jgi:hypothetical protein
LAIGLLLYGGGLLDKGLGREAGAGVEAGLFADHVDAGAVGLSEDGPEAAALDATGRDAPDLAALGHQLHVDVAFGTDDGVAAGVEHREPACGL